MNDLVPGAPSPGELLDAPALERLYAYPDRPWVRANMVATLDGAAAGNDGDTATLNTPADLEVFTLLRDLADVVLVGAGTARSEDYRRLGPRTGGRRERAVAEGRAAHPELAVVSGTGRVPAALAQEPPEDTGGVSLVTCEAAGSQALDRARRTLGADRVLVCGADRVDLRAAVGALAARGLPRVLCEGGPSLLADVAAEGVLDEMCLTVVPLMAGGLQQRVAVGTAADLPLVPGVVVESGGTLLQRWVRAGG